MNIIPSDYIRDFVITSFGKTGRISSNHAEMTVPSMFVSDDWKRHMSINLTTGMWQDFKSGERGNFIKLYSLVKGISIYEAIERVAYDTATLDPQVIVEAHKVIELIDLIPVTIDSCFTSDDQAVIDAWTYLYGRGLFSVKNPKTFFVSTAQSFIGRAIIPYFNDIGEVIFLQGRSIAEAKPKYLSREMTILPQSSILYPFDRGLDYVVVCEGPIDAISLQIGGINATCTNGSHMSIQQAKQLKEFGGTIIMGYDNDNAGWNGLKSADKIRRDILMSSLSFCPPPPECKDWNDALLREVDFHSYIEKSKRIYDFANSVMIQ